MEFLDNTYVYEGQEPSRNRAAEPARQATQPGGIGSLYTRFLGS